jgi:hypothetical protein
MYIRLKHSWKNMVPIHHTVRREDFDISYVHPRAALFPSTITKSSYPVLETFRDGTESREVDVVDVAATKRCPPWVAIELVVAFEIIIVAESSLSEPYTLYSKDRPHHLPNDFRSFLSFDEQWRSPPDPVGSNHTRMTMLAKWTL